jgi:undecaprenyl-diphosphatase
VELAHAVILALVQGLTEFLPISSSGHLILMPALLGWQDPGLAFDIAVHLGTLVALLAYFRRDLPALIAGLAKPGRPESRLTWALIVGSVPLGLGGLLLADYEERLLRSPLVIAVATAVFAILLWAADRYRRGTGSERELSWSRVFAIGASQVLSLVPGTSRSGVTITAGLALGLSREAASRFSFLLAVPAIGMAVTWQLWQLVRAPDAVNWDQIAIGTLVACATAFATLALFLRVIGRIGMGAFALYRLALTAVIVYVLL